MQHGSSSVLSNVLHLSVTLISGEYRREGQRCTGSSPSSQSRQKKVVHTNTLLKQSEFHHVGMFLFIEGSVESISYISWRSQKVSRQRWVLLITHGNVCREFKTPACLSLNALDKTGFGTGDGLASSIRSSANEFNYISVTRILTHTHKSLWSTLADCDVFADGGGPDLFVWPLPAAVGTTRKSVGRIYIWWEQE